MRATCLRASVLGLTATLALAGTLGVGPAQTGAATRSAGVRTATARPSTILPAVDTIQIGPISAADGFDLYVTEQGCGSPNANFQATFIKGSAPDFLSHTYTGPAATCSIFRSPAGAQLRVSLAHTLDINVRIGSVGTPLRRPGLPIGCGAPYGPELPARATGLIDVAIHTPVFGRHNASQATAEIFSGAPQNCPGVQPLTGRELTADVGPYVINATDPAHGSPQLDVYDGFGDTSANGLAGALQLELGGSAAYDVNTASGSARLSAAAPLANGGMTFTPLAACPGAQAQNGSLAGTLTISDPVLGRLAINGRYAQQAFSGVGGAQPGTCNGPGSAPVTPDIVSSCDQSNFECSVSAGTNTVTVFDETDPGTQTISSESLDFGDGSPPVLISDDGSAQHAYGAPGTYTATVTVTDAMGTTATATDEIYIEP